MAIVLLNYAHPLSDTQRQQAQTLLQENPDIRDISFQADRTRPLTQVAEEIANAAGLTSHEWQTTPIVLNPPGLAPLALALTAEIHGRRGDFPAILNVRPVEGSVPTRYEIAEIVNLQTLRLAARTRR